MIWLKQLFIVLALAASFNAAIAQTPPFKAGILEDDFVYDVAPFPGCHAATIVETPAGLVCAFFGGTDERNPDVEIYVCRKQGRKWTSPTSVANGIQNEKLRYPTWNPVLYQVPDGDLLLFYKVGPSPSTWTGWVKTSKDNGISWSEAKALPKGFIGPVKNKPVLVGKQRLLAPSSKEDNGWQLHFERSDDFGKTWKMGTPLNDGKTLSAIQPTILIHPNDSLQMLARSKNRAILQAWSTDNGETWSALTKTTLPNNNSGLDAVTLKDGRYLLVYNHILGTGNEGGGPRSPLNVSYSPDGQNWFAALVLENSPISEYSYPSIIQSADGMVHIVYTWRRQKVKYVKLDPTKLEGKKIENGLWPY